MHNFQEIYFIDRYKIFRTKILYAINIVKELKHCRLHIISNIYSMF